MSWRVIIVQIAIAVVIVLATTVIHGAGTYVVIRRLERYRRELHRLHPRAREIWFYVSSIRFVADVALTMFLASILEMFLWAAVYLRLGLLGDFGTAVYFSAITFAAVGYGDVTLQGAWRLLSALEGANGVILFGWSASLVFAAVREVVISKRSPGHEA